jgi:hypothetical protein
MMDDTNLSDNAHLSGNVAGHVIPGSFFVGFGLFFLFLTAWRLFKAESNEEFCSNHIPERNMSLLKWVSAALVICSILGILGEGIGRWLILGDYAPGTNTFFNQLQHITLYFLFVVAGSLGFFESINWLPANSFRTGISLGFLAQALIWHEHSLMKMNLVDQRIHALIAFTSLASGVFMIVSIYKPSHLVPYVASLLFITWQGAWLFAAAYNIQAEKKFDLEEMTSCFVLLGLFLVCGVILYVIILHRKRANYSSGVKHGDYLPVHFNNNLTYDNEDEDSDEAPTDESDSSFGSGTVSDDGIVPLQVI